MFQPEHKLKTRQLCTLLLYVAILNAPVGWGWQLQQRSQVPLVRVPPLIGQNLGRAQALLTGSGLRLGQVIRVVSGRPPDTVLQQKPEAGTFVRYGSLIDIAVATPVLMPNLIGLDLAQARAVLSRLKLELTQVVQQVSQQRPGTVVEQLPRAGTAVRPGMPLKVAVAISSPPPVRQVAVPQVRVPELVGSDQEKARALLAQSGLQLGSVGHRAGLPQGIVIWQEPAAGTPVAPGTMVSIIIASGAARIPVPRIVGFDRPRATRVLDRAGLRLVVGEERASNQSPGTVLQQQPAAGVLVAAGAPVVVTIAARLVQVPDLTGRNLNQAIAALTDARLQLGHVEQRLFGGKSGAVFEQHPQAGARVTAGTIVSVVIVNPLGAYVFWFGGGLVALGAASLIRRYVRTQLPHLLPRPDLIGSQTADPVPVVLAQSEIRVRLVFDPGEQSLLPENI
ncbi:MAG: hypothetical protein DMF60_00225 [Acidobacteria bacterium]|nr:MAG: hypothetical protein DMF60_00225 [Acidobacteriota bacterium]